MLKLYPTSIYAVLSTNTNIVFLKMGTQATRYIQVFVDPGILIFKNRLILCMEWPNSAASTLRD